MLEETDKIYQLQPKEKKCLGVIFSLQLNGVLYKVQSSKTKRRRVFFIWKTSIFSFIYHNMLRFDILPINSPKSCIFVLSIYSDLLIFKNPNSHIKQVGTGHLYILDLRACLVVCWLTGINAPRICTAVSCGHFCISFRLVRSAFSSHCKTISSQYSVVVKYWDINVT